MTCARCATINPQGSTVCASCGAPLVLGMAPPPPSAYMPPGGYMPPGYAMPPPQRSGIPKVIGIIMIVFGALGLLFTLSSLVNGPKNEGMSIDPEAFDKLKTMTKMFALIDLAVGVLHLFAGIRLAGYKKNGPTLAFSYAILKIVASVVEIVIVYAWLMPVLDKVNAPSNAKALVGGLFAFFIVISAVWPIIVMALVSRPAAKQACQGPLS